MAKKGKEPNQGCSPRRTLLVCVLIVLAFWPLLFTLYFTTSEEQVDGELAAPVGPAQRHLPETQKKKSKHAKQAKGSPARATESPESATESKADSARRVALRAAVAKEPSATEPPKPPKKAAWKESQPDPAADPSAPKASLATTHLPKTTAAPAKDKTASVPKNLLRSGNALPNSVKPCPALAGKRKGYGSFGLVTRLFNNDLPYVGSFIRHYQDLGVHTFYFALTKKAHGTDVRAYLLDLPFLDATAWQLFKNDRAEPKRFPVGVLGDMVKWVKEDYIVQVDIDEYVTLACDKKDFGELVASQPNVALFRFGWVTVPLDSRNSFIVQPPYRGVEWQGAKFLVKREAVESVPSGDQKVKLNCAGESDCQTKIMPRSLVHFYARGFGDGLVKSIGNVHDNDQDSTSKKLGWLASKGRLPPRLRMLAYIAVSSEKSGSGVVLDSERLPILTVDRGQESRLLQSYDISAKVVEQVSSAYDKYKANITRDTVWRKIKGEASLAGVARAVRW